MASFRLKPEKPERSLHFDEYLSVGETASSSPAASTMPSKLVLPHSVHYHLWLVCTLEELCHINMTQGRDIFQLKSEQLVKLKEVSALLMLDEMSSLREQYRQRVHFMLVADLHKNSQEKMSLPAPHLKSGVSKQIQQPSASSSDINQTSRYCTEFVEIEEIGRGGFGAVYKSKHKLDGKLYAVKKVRFKHSNPEDLFRALREVNALASLQHTNIVGYNTAWLEYGDTYTSPSAGDNGLGTASYPDDDPTDSSDDNIIFEDGCEVGKTFPISMGPTMKEINSNWSSLASSPQNYKTNSFGKNISYRKEQDESTGESNSIVDDSISILSFLGRDFPLQTSGTLYIQMELCHHTLKEWMQQRNEQPVSEEELQSYTGKNMNIFGQIIKAVEYMHSCGVIHRDLNPRNIFFDKEGHVKVGDFGLATEEIVSIPLPDDTVPFLDPFATRIVRTGSVLSDHTPGVGTPTYAAPEQLKGSKYNAKADMYSLGIMLLEFFQNFGTGMERIICLKDVRCGIIPDMVQQNWPVQTRFIELMTEEVPEKRPSAKELLSECLGVGETASSSPAASTMPSKVVLSHSVHYHLWLVSTLEELCHINMTHGRDIFQLKSEQLVKLKEVSALLPLDEMSSLREQYRQRVHCMIEADVHKTNQEKLSLPAPNLKSCFSKQIQQPSASSSDMNQTSRYCTEFVEIEEIGKGGFGAVYKSQHKLDGKLYAVKKVRFKHSHPEDLFRVLREVKALANLQHTNIVGYNTAWLEYGDRYTSPSAGDNGLGTASYPDDDPTDSSDDNIIFEDRCEVGKTFPISMGPTMKEINSNCSSLASSPQNNKTNTSSFGKNISYRKEQDESTGESNSIVDDGKSSLPFLGTDFPLQTSGSLYIQMELCHHTLKEWMQQRNEQPVSEEELLSYTGKNMNIFGQIIKAVEYMHSRGVIHRDLNPRNIFLDNEGLHVKVGDFGLAIEEIVSIPLPDDTVPFLDSFGTRIVLSDHTPGVGTPTYAAPEQLKGSKYNTKADMYSLGIILLEFFQNFGTEMERIICLKDVRCGIIPDMVQQNWPVQTLFIELMTNEVPENRPSAKDLLSGELYESKDQVNASLSKETVGSA